LDMIFKNRKHAGEVLGSLLKKSSLTNSIVVSVPRGGLPVGYSIAQAIGVPMTIVFAKKIGHPTNPEYAIGAVTADDFFVEDDFEVPVEYLNSEVNRLQSAIRTKQEEYSVDSTMNFKGKTLIIADDGVATGRTLMALIHLLRKKDPKKIIVAVPVGPRDSLKRLTEVVDEVVCPMIVDDFPGVGYFFEDFRQVSDEDAIEFLRKSA
jgi:putative phosphoribosyl transferase